MAISFSPQYSTEPWRQVPLSRGNGERLPAGQVRGGVCCLRAHAIFGGAISLGLAALKERDPGRLVAGLVFLVFLTRSTGVSVVRGQCRAGIFRTNQSRSEKKSAARGWPRHSAGDPAVPALTHCLAPRSG